MRSHSFRKRTRRPSTNRRKRRRSSTRRRPRRCVTFRSSCGIKRDVLCKEQTHTSRQNFASKYSCFEIVASAGTVHLKVNHPVPGRTMGAAFQNYPRTDDGQYVILPWPLLPGPRAKIYLWFGQNVHDDLFEWVRTGFCENCPICNNTCPSELSELCFPCKVCQLLHHAHCVERQKRKHSVSVHG